MWRRTLKVLAIGYAVKTAVFLAVWLAAPDLVRQGRDKVRDAWAALHAERAGARSFIP